MHTKTKIDKNTDENICSRKTVKNIIKDLEGKGIVEHLNIALLHPKKSNVITVYKKDNVIWIDGGEYIPVVSSPQLSTHKIFMKSINEMVVEEAYCTILDRLFPRVCNCELSYCSDVNGNPMYIDRLRNILKLIGAKRVEDRHKMGSIFSTFSKKDKILVWRIS